MSDKRIFLNKSKKKDLLLIIAAVLLLLFILQQRGVNNQIGSIDGVRIRAKELLVNDLDYLNKGAVVRLDEIGKKFTELSHLKLNLERLKHNLPKDDPRVNVIQEQVDALKDQSKQLEAIRNRVRNQRIQGLDEQNISQELRDRYKKGTLKELGNIKETTIEDLARIKEQRLEVIADLKTNRTSINYFETLEESRRLSPVEAKHFRAARIESHRLKELEHELSFQGKLHNKMKSALAGVINEHNQLKNAKTLLKKSKNAGELVENLKKIGMLDEAKMLEESSLARRLAQGALESGGPKEMARAMKIAKRMNQLSGGLNVGGGVLDILAFTAAVEGMIETGEKMKDTDNQALKDLYNRGMITYGIEAGEAAAGFSIGAYVIGSAALGEGSFLVALGSSGGLIMLPIGVIVGGGIYYIRSVDEITEGWARDIDDWKKFTPAQLQKELADRIAGKESGFWQRYAYGGPVLFAPFMDNEDAYKRIEEAQKGAKYYITAAYMINSEVPLIPKKENETDEAYKKRIKLMIGDAMAYLFNKNKDLDFLDSSIYKRALTHAELIQISHDLKQTGGSIIIDINGKKFDLANYTDLDYRHYITNKDGITRGDVIAGYKLEKLRALTDLYRKLALVSEDKKIKLRQRIMQLLLVEVQHSLNKADQKIVAIDWPWYDDDNEDNARRALYYRFNKKLAEVTSKLMELDREITRKDIMNALGGLKEIAQADPRELEEEGSKIPTYPQRDERDSWIDPFWILDRLNK